MILRVRYFERPFLVFFVFLFVIILYSFHTGFFRKQEDYSAPVHAIQRPRPGWSQGPPEAVQESNLFGSPNQEKNPGTAGGDLPPHPHQDIDEPPPYDSPTGFTDMGGSRTETEYTSPVNELPILHSTFHPIDDLIEGAHKEFEKLLQQQTQGVDEAAAAYRQRRGRHPPPGFRQWAEVAENNGGLMIESFYDQIYEDLEPFWAISPAELRDAPLKHGSALTMEIFNGTLDFRAERPAEHLVRVQNIILLLQHTIVFMSDVRMIINHEPNSVNLVPYEEMQRLRQVAEMTKSTNPPGLENLLQEEYQEIQELPKIELPERPENVNPPPSFQDQLRDRNRNRFWSYARQTCPPNSAARNSSYSANLTMPPTFPSGELPGFYGGYVADWKVATSPCDQPHLRNLHGGLIDPVGQAVSTQLVPVFSPSKIRGMSNDILIPDPEYLTDDARFEAGRVNNVSWESKLNRVMWRGSGAGGKHKADNWRHFHRQRLVSMLNGTQVSLTELKLAAAGNQLTPENFDTIPPLLPHNFPILNETVYPLSQLELFEGENVRRDPQNLPNAALLPPGDHKDAPDHPVMNPYFDQSSVKPPTPLGRWLNNFTHASFNHMGCHPLEQTSAGPNPTCSYLDDFYRTEPYTPREEMLQNRYLPDVDGISHSSRYRVYLQSKSLPIKSTIYAEWHDSRLIPWVHFVPMGNTFTDLYGILDYFQHDESRQKLAQMIAEQGSDWAGKVLRENDMAFYLHRLILEFTRLLNDDRDLLAWVEDFDWPPPPEHEAPPPGSPQEKQQQQEQQQQNGNKKQKHKPKPKHKRPPPKQP